ncbi:hypothetical protein PR202_gb22761 [Eleusine coracana subsp. coracana]|uniref:BHLH domain-containing protein n=1 Tax=Eleusine coracana subsp. coracana TaxID=191504 RepID=A0AAV5FEG4_ELECO|nr:hypothetical protein PR202_gb22761 [Eleusine coracana subsp. coracana]
MAASITACISHAQSGPLWIQLLHLESARVVRLHGVYDRRKANDESRTTMYFQGEAPPATVSRTPAAAVGGVVGAQGAGAAAVGARQRAAVPADRLLLRTADYIVRLRARVELLRAVSELISAHHGSSDHEDDNDDDTPLAS